VRLVNHITSHHDVVNGSRKKPTDCQQPADNEVTAHGTGLGKGCANEIKQTKPNEYLGMMKKLPKFAHIHRHGAKNKKPVADTNRKRVQWA